MFFENYSLLSLLLWPPIYVVRVVLSSITWLCLMLVLGRPKEQESYWLKKVCIVLISIFSVVFGLDLIGHPVENACGFHTIETACLYSCRGTVFATIEGKDSSLVASGKKARVLSGQTKLFGDVSIYSKKGSRWLAVTPRIKEKQIVAKKETQGFIVYLLNNKGSNDFYLVIYDFGGSAAMIYFSDDKMQNIVEEDGSIYWFSKCDTSSEEMEIDIKEGSEWRHMILSW